MKIKIKTIIINGLFKYLNYKIDLNESLNVIHGINGQGKTTILNIITTILNGDFKKFYQLSFQEVKLVYYDDNYIRIYRETRNDKNSILFDYRFDGKIYERKDTRLSNSVNAYLKRFNSKPLYLPAQRVSLNDHFLDRNLTHEEELYHYRRSQYKNRDNSFKSSTNMIDVNSIERSIVERIRRFSMKTNRMFSHADNKLFESFFTNLLTDQTDKLFDKKSIVDKLDQIKKHKELYYTEYKHLYQQTKVLEKIESSILDINQASKEIDLFLDVYIENIKMKNSIVEKFVKSFTNFSKIINELFQGKQIKIKLDASLDNMFKIITESQDTIKIRDLSSGEKNILLIFYHFFFEMEDNTIFMIDEPELSLHIDWQENMLRYFLEHSNNDQIIVVTHSPDILQGYRDNEINLTKCKVNA